MPVVLTIDPKLNGTSLTVVLNVNNTVRSQYVVTLLGPDNSTYQQPITVNVSDAGVKC